MAGISAPIIGILNKLSELQVYNGSGSYVQPYIRVWNNQLEYMRNGGMEMFPLPAIFVELQPFTLDNMGGQGMRGVDVTFTIHILHEFYNALDGTFAQDLDVFTLRDRITQKLSFFEAEASGPLQCISERPDYDHDNIYHYTMDFKCHFVDSIGSKLDLSNGYYIENIPPTDLNLNITIE